MRAILVVTGLVALVAGLFLLGSFIIMVVWNALAGYFDFKTISFTVAMLINFALGIVGGAFRQTTIE